MKFYTYLLSFDWLPPIGQVHRPTHSTFALCSSQFPFGPHHRHHLLQEEVAWYFASAFINKSWIYFRYCETHQAHARSFLIALFGVVVIIIMLAVYIFWAASVGPHIPIDLYGVAWVGVSATINIGHLRRVSNSSVGIFLKPKTREVSQWNDPHRSDAMPPAQTDQHGA